MAEHGSKVPPAAGPAFGNYAWRKRHRLVPNRPIEMTIVWRPWVDSLLPFNGTYRMRTH